MSFLKELTDAMESPEAGESIAKFTKLVEQEKRLRLASQMLAGLLASQNEFYPKTHTPVDRDFLVRAAVTHADELIRVLKEGQA